MFPRRLNNHVYSPPATIDPSGLCGIYAVHIARPGNVDGARDVFAQRGALLSALILTLFKCHPYRHIA